MLRRFLVVLLLAGASQAALAQPEGTRIDSLATDEELGGIIR
jgi:hypothetical protein